MPSMAFDHGQRCRRPSRALGRKRFSMKRRRIPIDMIGQPGRKNRSG
jgi:hypothetical protein